MSYGVDDTTGLSGQEYSVSILIRVATTLYLVAIVVRDILSPDHDPVRTDGLEEDRDDPGGGVFDGAPDVVTLGRAGGGSPDSRPRG